MSKPNQSKSIKSLRNGRSLRLEGLETRQLLSANMLGAMQSDAVETAIVSTETAVPDCTAEAMLAIAQQTAPSSYAAAQMAELLPTAGEETNQDQNTTTQESALAKVKVSYKVTATDNDIAITITNMDKLDGATGFDITFMNRDGSDVCTKHIAVENILVNGKTATINIPNITDLAASTQYKINVVAKDANGVSNDVVKSFRTGKVAADVVDVTGVEVNDADMTSSVVVTWKAAFVSETETTNETGEDGNPVQVTKDVYAKDYSITLYTVTRDGENVTYKKAKTVRARNIDVEDGECSYTVSGLKAGTEYAVSIKVNSFKTDKTSVAASLESIVDLDETATTYKKGGKLNFTAKTAGDEYVVLTVNDTYKEGYDFTVTYKEGKDVKEANAVFADGKLTISDLKSNTSYRFSISAVESGENADEASPIANVSIRTTKEAYKAPENVTCGDETNKTVTVKWKAVVSETETINETDEEGNVVTDSEGNPVQVTKDVYATDYTITLYTVTRDGENVTYKKAKTVRARNIVAEDGQCSYTVSGLKAGTEYKVEVKTSADKDHAESEAVAAVDNVTTLAELKNVKFSNKDTVTKSDTVTLKVANPNDFTDCQGIKFTVTYTVGSGKNAKTGIATSSYDSENNTLTISKLEANTSYRFSVNVTAENAISSRPANVSIRTTKEAYKAPENVTCGDETNKTVTVKWTPVVSGTETINKTDDNGDVVKDSEGNPVQETKDVYATDYTITLYTVTRDGENVTYKKAKTVRARNIVADENGKCSYTVSGLKAGTEYKVEVKTSADKDHAESEAVSANVTTFAELKNVSFSKKDTVTTSESVTLKIITEKKDYADYLASGDFTVTYTVGSGKNAETVTATSIYNSDDNTLTISGLEAETKYKFAISLSLNSEDGVKVMTKSATTITVKTSEAPADTDGNGTTEAPTENPEEA